VLTESPLRVALTSYRSKPHCGGQGVYVRQMSAALTDLGHHVEVFSGPPYPELDPRVRLVEIPSLDLYAEPDPFRRPALREFRSLTDVQEYAIMCTAGFGEPRTFARRVVKALRPLAADFDVVHDNQTLGRGLLELPKLGMPVLGTIHHPISVDKRLELAVARGRKRLTLRRWYGFVAMQARVARRLPLHVTPSSSSAADVVRDFGLRAEQLRIVPIGVDVDVFRPQAERVAGRIVTVASADVPLKGLLVLLRAMAAMRDVNAELIVVSKPAPGGATEKLVAELGLGTRVQFVSGLSEERLATLIASAEVAVVPSLYEGFSLPAVEAMASGTPLIASDVASLPEVVGRDGSCGVLVPAGDAEGFARAITDLLADPQRRAAMGAAGRARAVEKFSWRATAESTVACYREAIAAHQAAQQPNAKRAAR
jgi:glycosyltransferase involved in cell wall biosynthesis